MTKRLFLVLLLGLASATVKAAWSNPSMTAIDQTFASLPALQTTSRDIDDTIALAREKYKLGLPANFQQSETYGLVVFNSASDDAALPLAWGHVLARRKLLILSPLKAGNSQPTSRRMGLVVLGALAMQRDFNIDPHRIYAAGISGGARVASSVAFLRPDLFSGTIQSVGSNFPAEVPAVHAKGNPARDKEPYGILRTSDTINASKVKKNVRFTILTGPGDFRHGYLLDIYQGGFQPNGYQCQLFDIPSMGHEIASPQTLDQALDYIEGATGG